MRDLSSDVITALESSVIYPAFLVEIETAGGTVRVWSGVGTLSWGGSPPNQWLGVGNLGSISAIPETNQVTAQGIKLTLSGIPSDMISLALADAQPTKPVKVYIVLFTSAGMLIDAPYQAFSGRTDAINLAESGDTATLEISCESRLIDLQRSRERRYTDQDQQLDFPGDLGFAYVEQLQQYNLTWGSNAPNIPLAARLS